MIQQRAPIEYISYDSKTHLDVKYNVLRTTCTTNRSSLAFLPALRLMLSMLPISVTDVNNRDERTDELINTSSGTRRYNIVLPGIPSTYSCLIRLPP